MKKKDQRKQRRALASPRNGKGQFLRGRSGNPSGRPRQSHDEDLDAIIAGNISRHQVARALGKLALKGDPRSLDRVCTALERQQTRQVGSAINYSLLSELELIALRAIVNKSQGRLLDAEDVAMLAKIAAPPISLAPEEVEEPEPEEEVAVDSDPEPQPETATEIPMPSPSRDEEEDRLPISRDRSRSIFRVNDTVNWEN